MTSMKRGRGLRLNRKKKRPKSKSVIPPRDNGKHPGGRPTKLTLETQNMIAQAIRANAYPETAAALVGIDRDTFYTWLKRGAKEISGPYKEFSDTIKKALATGQMRDLAVIDRAANGYDVEKTRTLAKNLINAAGKKIGNTIETTTERYREFAWQAAAWRLERRFPRLWGKVERPETPDLPEEAYQDKPVMTLKRETIDIYAPDRLARLISAFGEAGLIPEEVVAQISGPGPA